MPAAQIRGDALAARLAPLGFAPAGWLGAARTEALARLAAMGLPAPRDEYWRYTDPRDLSLPEPPAAALFDDSDESPPFDAIDRLRLVFVDGVFDSAASDDPAGAGLQIARLSQVAGSDIHWAQDLYGTLEAQGQSPVRRPFAALNTAFATEGILIRATAQTDRPVALIYRRSSAASDVILHHCIRIDPGASLTLMESGPGAARLNTAMEVDIAAAGRFHHVRAQGRDHARRAATHIFARLGAGALFKSFTLSANGALTRNEVVIDLGGDDGVAHVAGAAVGDGAFHHDDTVFITHAALRCESRQVFKKVLKNGAVGVFQGKILVRPGAQQTDGYQISQALMLDGDSQFLARPELEIHADDVKCSHGSTSGAIDETALFYLRARGVPLATAQSLLVLAFLAETIAEIDDPAIAEDLRHRLENWLARHEG